MTAHELIEHILAHPVGQTLFDIAAFRRNNPEPFKVSPYRPGFYPKNGKPWNFRHHAKDRTTKDDRPSLLIRGLIIQVKRRSVSPPDAWRRAFGITQEEFVSRLEGCVQLDRRPKARDEVQIFGLDTGKDPVAIVNRVLTFLNDLSDTRKVDEPDLEGPVSGEEDEEETYREGRVAYRTHRRRERSRKLVRDKKAVASNPTLCEVCFQDYSRTYGAPGKSVIECHHLSPISKTRVLPIQAASGSCKSWV